MAYPAAIKSEKHVAVKGAVRLAVWRKFIPTVVRQGDPPLLLVHGSSLCARPTFDLHVPGKPDYSMMDWFALRGFDVWTCDHEGYGESSITESDSGVACGVEDLEAVTTLIGHEAAPRVSVYGLSSGSLRAGAFTASFPDRLHRLILDAFVWTGEGSRTLADRRTGAASFTASKRRAIDRAFIASIFNRDKDGTTDPEVIEACASAQLAFGDSVPSGTYADMTMRLPLVDPSKIATPTLIVRGEHDGIASMADLLAFFDHLPTSDKQFAVIPGLAHCTPLGTFRHRMWHAVHQFLLAGRAVNDVVPSLR
jgi:non-heme chloroperoxidase